MNLLQNLLKRPYKAVAGTTSALALVTTDAMAAITAPTMDFAQVNTDFQGYLTAGGSQINDVFLGLMAMASFALIAWFVAKRIFKVSV